MGGYLSFNFLAPYAAEILLLMTLALSLNLINGCAGMFSLGHQGFYGVGAYAAGAFVLWWGTGWAALAASIAVGGAAAAIFGFLVGIPCLRLKGDYLAIATLGFAEIFRIAVSQIDYVGGPRGLDIPYVAISRTRAHRFEFYLLYIGIAFALLVVAFLVIRNIMRSSHGRAIYAIREDEVAAELLGVDLTRYKVAVFVIGAAFAGLAGAVRMHQLKYVTPDAFNLQFGVILLLYVVLGGQGRLLGSMLAVLVLYGVERALATNVFGLLPSAAAPWWQVTYALLLILIVLARPQGIMGKKNV